MPFMERYLTPDYFHIIIVKRTDKRLLVQNRVRLETAKINYECDFVDGKCKKTRLWKDYGLKTGSCCDGCAISRGYFEYHPNSNFMTRETFKTLAKLFDKTRGFWRPNRGCILPRWMRSRTCLGFNCATTNKKYNAIYNLVNITV